MMQIKTEAVIKQTLQMTSLLLNLKKMMIQKKVTKQIKKKMRRNLYQDRKNLKPMIPTKDLQKKTKAKVQMINLKAKRVMHYPSILLKKSNMPEFGYSLERIKI